MILEKPNGSLMDQQVFTKHGASLANTARELLFHVGKDVQGN